jgi:ubiquinone biosynthesis accessory factor UbiJ
MQLSAGVIAGLESVINRYLRLDPDTGTRMATLSGHCIGIDLQGIDLQLFIYPDQQGIQLKGHIDAEPDTVLHGTPLGMARLGLGQSTEKTLFSGAVSITGDVETGQAFKAVLDDMEIDWEEQLSMLTGDVIAHQLGNTARRASEAFRHSRHTLEQDIGEYLQEELRLLPSRIETENFSAAVTGISIDADRLAARLKRLQNKVNIGSNR